MSEPTATGLSITTIDNALVRVTRWNLAPGAGTGVHRHNFAYVVVPLTSGLLRVTNDQGDESVNHVEPGGSYFRQAGAVHEVSNDGNASLSFVEVEILQRQS